MGVLRKINEAVKAKDLEGLMGGEIMGNPSKWPGSGLTPVGERYATIEGTIEKTNKAKLDEASAKLYQKLREAENYPGLYDGRSCSDFEEYGCYADNEVDDDDYD